MALRIPQLSSTHSETNFITNLLEGPKQRTLMLAGGGALVGAIALGIVTNSTVRDFFGHSECRFAGAAECVNAKSQESVVSIKTEEGSGAGVAIASNRLLTNAHVVGSSPTVTIELPDGSQVTGKVLGFAKAGVDLALVEIEQGGKLSPLPMAKANAVKVGETIFAIGNPLDRGTTLTQGIVSQVKPRWVQLDAAINPGNSGGALLNKNGELVGLVTAKLRGEGGGLAIPIDRIQEFLNAAKADEMPRTEVLVLPPDLAEDPVPLSLDDTPVKAQLTEASNPYQEKDGKYSFFDVYIFEGKANQEVTITMSSTKINPYLIIFGPDGKKLAEAGNNGGNAILNGNLAVDGTYVIFANSKNAEEVGSYSIRASAKE